MKKSQIEIECENLEKKYREKFKEPYPWDDEDSRPYSYHIEALKRSIKTGIPAKSQKIPKGAIH